VKLSKGGNEYKGGKEYKGGTSIKEGGVKEEMNIKEGGARYIEGRSQRDGRILRRREI
jgi:hypothetical protein